MAPRNKKLKSFLAFLLVFGPAITLVFISTRGCSHKFKNLNDFGPVQMDTFQIYNPTSKTFEKATLKNFEGDILLISSIQPSCPENCLISLWHFEQLIYNHIFENKHKKLKQVKILSFLTDEFGNDLSDIRFFENTFESLSGKLENFDPSLWYLARGKTKSIYNIESNGENLLYSSEREYGTGAFLRYLMLLDKESHLRMVLPADKEGEIRVMFQHLTLLQKEYSQKRK